MPEQPILVTGAAGFIGFHIARQLLAEGREVIGLDNLNNYYDPALKQARLALLQADPRFSFVKADLADRPAIAALFAKYRFAVVLHLAAQAGVRYSIEQPHAYVDANLEGFANILEGCRHHSCRHLLYASSSSVYGANTKVPFSVDDSTDHPISFYAATKKANELMAYSYSHLYRLPVTGMRFFTIYGPWGRPDMALFLFTKAILEGRPIKLFNHGIMRRDFTYIGDVTRVISRLIGHIPPDNGAGGAPARIYNVGNNHPEELNHVVALLEQALGRTAVKEMLPMQPGDVPATFADVGSLTRDIGFRPETRIEDGVHNFVAWYRDHYKV
ncbi:MAG TPA: NAD-dependent epimerase [Bradyrhizobium sp.]|nr:NAD-dependent epimerase [Bradyrhizobium sp.]